MKRAIIILICLAALIGCKRTNRIEGYYPLTTIVYDMDRENDVVTVEDANGNLWAFEGCEDWEINDICSLLMYDNGTESIYDDEIIIAHYNGTVEEL